MGQKDSPKLLLLSFVVIAMFGLAIFLFYGDKKTDQNIINTATISRSPKTYTVYYEGGVFSPTNMRIHAGDSVRFQNDSADDVWIIGDRRSGLFFLSALDSKKALSQGEFYIYRFERQGSFAYKNSLEEKEIGSIIVRP